MLNKTNLATGATMILAGASEIAVSGGVICPVCIGAITSGAAIIASEFGIKITK